MKRTVLKARLAGAVGLASISMIALAACGGGGGTVTTGGDDEKTTEASSEAATTDAATSDAAGGTQAATDADVDGAKQVVVDFYDKAANGDFAGACQLVMDPVTNKPADPSSGFGAQCVQGLEAQKDLFAQAKGVITKDALEATVEPDGTISVTATGAGANKLKVVKSADGQFYVDLLGTGAAAG